MPETSPAEQDDFQALMAEITELKLECLDRQFLAIGDGPERILEIFQETCRAIAKAEAEFVAKWGAKLQQEVRS